MHAIERMMVFNAINIIIANCRNTHNTQIIYMQHQQRHQSQKIIFWRQASKLARRRVLGRSLQAAADELRPKSAQHLPPPWGDLHPGVDDDHDGHDDGDLGGRAD